MRFTLLKTWRHNAEAPRATAPENRRPLDALPILSSQELLVARRQQVNQIEELAGASPQHFERYYLAVLHRFASFVQQVPASEAHHHAHAGGLLDHALEVACTALKLRQGYLLPPGAAAEDAVLKRDLWTYAVFTAALAHDVAKPATDQSITVFDAAGECSWRWDPWATDLTDDPRARWYRIEFDPKRRYRIHERAALLLAQRVFAHDAIAWLAGDREVFSAWLACIVGDPAQAGPLGEILGTADGQSVARNLGAEPTPRAAKAAVVPLQEKLVTALRHLVDSGALPLNRNGAAGWRVGDALWLVSKRTMDELRQHLMQAGHTGIPTHNDRLYDVLQEHGILTPCEGRAIWRATVQGDGYAHDLTLIRIPVTRLWGADTGPGEFAGQVIAETLAQSPDQLPSGGVSPVGEAPDETQDPPQSKSEAPGAKPAHWGEQFLAWLTDGLAAAALAANHPQARVHVVPEGVLLASPGIFQDYVAACGSEVDWQTVQKYFLRLKLHQRTNDGANVHAYSVDGSGKISGLLVADRAKIFGANAPKPNPRLRKI